MVKPVVIVGGGVSGLVTAIELQKKSIPFILVEKSNRLGGRIATDYENGYQFDRGFQVFQTAYPEAKRYLDYEKLKLKSFKPGARVFSENIWNTISDPFRDFGAFFETIFSGIGNVKDKWLTLKLRTESKALPTEILFSKPQSSTSAFIKEYGFSNEFIKLFFQPFFAGIFLDDDLETSSDAFRFIFKMFTEGEAAIPSKGMSEIINQLASQINPNSLKLSTAVKSIQSNEIILEDDSIIDAKAIVICGQNSLLSSTEKTEWNATECLYFEAPNSIVNQPYLLLNSNEQRTINHLAFLSDIATEYAPQNKRLVSVTLTAKTKFSEDSTLNKVKQELELLFPGTSPQWNFLKHYSIPKSLPKKHQIIQKDYKMGEYLFRAGDETFFGSVNYAMLSGRKVAEVVAENV